MIKHQTVFVLGAGASYPYGFPTGEGLVNEIIGLASADRTLEAFLYNDCVDRDVKRFAHDLAESDASSVDAFLEYRPDYLRIGKLAICMSLIPKERDIVLSRYERQNSSRGRMAWYHYLWNVMSTAKGGFGENRVSFVTLNYDRTLERYFFLRLKAQHQYADDEEVFKELYQLPFVHVYGSLGDERFTEDPFNRAEPSPEEVRRASERLRIIHEETERRYLSQAVELLNEASVICFLGYGFHGLNNGRLKLAEIKKERYEPREWFATSYGMTNAEFRRRTSQFYDRFVKDEFGQAVNHIGGQNDGALEVLRNLPVIITSW
jgi:hypothetical protein